jgi:hypothetical protein
MDKRTDSMASQLVLPKKTYFETMQAYNMQTAQDILVS